jgi:hypothetical protein
MIPKIFISGPLTATNSIDFLKNVRSMTIYGGEIRNLGAATYIPCTDVMVSLSYDVFNRLDYLQHDLEWLRVCDAIAVVPYSQWEESKGVQGEITLAKKLGLPVFYEIEEVSEYIKACRRLK